MILGLDPGTTHTGMVSLEPDRPIVADVLPNADVLDLLRTLPHCPVAIEMVACYGMPVGKEVFETCVWIGRFVQVAGPERVRLVYRRDVKLHICGNVRAKEANIRTAIIDRYGGKAEAVGTVKSQGPLYRVKSHAWSALAVALTALETKP